MSLVNKLRSTEVTPRTALLSIVGLVLATAGVLTAVVKLVNAPSSSAEAPERVEAPVATASAPELNSGKTAVEPLGTPDYAVIVKRNLFRPTGKIAVAPPVAPPIQAPPPIPRFTGVPPFIPFASSEPTVPILPPPPLAFTGVVEIAGETYALIEHLESKEAQYVPLDGTAFDCTVTQIAARSIGLEYAGRPFTLDLGENKTEPEPTPPAAQPSAPPGGGTPPGGAAPSGTGRPTPGSFRTGTPPQPGSSGGFSGRGRTSRGTNPGEG
jgi:hypothetical protein